MCRCNHFRRLTESASSSLPRTTELTGASGPRHHPSNGVAELITKLYRCYLSFTPWAQAGQPASNDFQQCKLLAGDKCGSAGGFRWIQVPVYTTIFISQNYHPACKACAVWIWSRSACCCLALNSVRGWDAAQRSAQLGQTHTHTLTCFSSCSCVWQCLVSTAKNPMCPRNFGTFITTMIVGNENLAQWCIY